MNISVVIPLLNEEDSLKELHDWIVSVMQSNSLSYEILFIDDGSTDNSWKVITQLSEANTSVKSIRFLKNFGKELKSEFYIPSAIDKLINDGTLNVNVLDTDSSWFGVTYQADKPIVMEKLNKLISEGAYPNRIY